LGGEDEESKGDPLKKCGLGRRVVGSGCQEAIMGFGGGSEEVPPPPGWG
jgi:hypothetical protein